jgi:hypothetical protein
MHDGGVGPVPTAGGSLPERFGEMTARLGGRGSGEAGERRAGLLRRSVANPKATL